MKIKINIVLASLAVVMSLSGCVIEALAISEPLVGYYADSYDNNKSQGEIKNENEAK
jgi:hypothetical protein